ncbi:MAG: beta-N-acetylhexosaminidase [Phycisphaerales bacterium]|nr:beta-N-acetylhexosaminidase [Phycisphaerales bacterium]
MTITADMPQTSIIPIPREICLRAGVFRLDASVCITFAPSTGALARMLADRLKQFAGLVLAVKPTGAAEGRQIMLSIADDDARLGREGYKLEVTCERVSLSAPTEAGLFYALQSLVQLLPVQSLQGRHQTPAAGATGAMLEIANQTIVDWPRFSWRGAMLDVSRHFFNVEQIKQFLDVMALHKLNVFHWHLTDDAGWRIQIYRYPRLTEDGAWRAGVGFGLVADATTAYDQRGRYGGYYTQQQIRDVVDYARQRQITIVPEIEMPGHALAVLHVYPEYGCTDGPFDIQMFSGIAEDVFCAGNEATFELLEQVLDEVAQLFPGPYIHIGGDECPKKRWKACPKCQARITSQGLKDEDELQSYFIKRIERHLDGLGKRLIGWDEILEGGLAANATVMSWRGVEGGIEAAQMGHDVVMTPHKRCYLNFHQSQDKKFEPMAVWEDVLTLEQTYTFEPVPAELNEQQRKHVLGLQGNIWTECIADPKHLQYMMFPRLSALSEVAWSQDQRRNLADFCQRMRQMQFRLDVLDIRYRAIDTGKQM